ncbi:MAG: YggS family pyridoxal phosphate-dependent enzyme [Egibacteraceae bacterium]
MTQAQEALPIPTSDAGRVAARLDTVRRRVADAAARVGRSPRSVTIVAVSKSFGVEHVRWAQQAGQVDFGESRAQELERKALVAQGVRWHFIGRLQGNKVRDVVGLAGLIHSVDRIELVQAIAERARRTRRIQQVLVQVNVGNDPAKGGCNPDDVFTLLTAIRQLDGIACQGLMTIPPLEGDPRPVFRRLAQFRDEVRTVWAEVQHLSMGMSGDFEVAVEEGATIVRVGEAVFGPRPGGRGESPHTPGGRGESPQAGAPSPK